MKVNNLSYEKKPLSWPLLKLNIEDGWLKIGNFPFSTCLPVGRFSILHCYLLDRVGPFLAFFKPGFFLSLILGSLLSNPYGFNVNLSSALCKISALAIPSLIASDCPAIPHPLKVISASKFLICSTPIVERESSALSKRYRFPPKYSWSDLSLPLGVLTMKLPLPLAKSLTIAVVSFLLPIA